MVNLLFHIEETKLVRLTNGMTANEGVPEIQSTNSGKWQCVCFDDFQNQTAEVICRELGYPGVSEIAFIDRACTIPGKTLISVQSCTERK